MQPKIILSALFFMICCAAYPQRIAFEKDPAKNTTATYDEVIHFYREITKKHPQAKLLEIGNTDVGRPLHLLVLSSDRDFDPKSIRSKNKAILLVNNGIHPGEPEGIDVSMMFVRDMLKKDTLPKNVVICVIPVYNISGMLNRGVSRANQNGPKSHGFRASRQHYDLNRDFVKGDTRNSRLFQQLFNTWDPDIFFDTHTSNGADYQHVMTLITTQKDKLAPQLSELLQRKISPGLYQRMADSGYPMIPYVDTRGSTPESGLVEFLETPRYSSGYAALHHTIGFMPETHMWKPYEQRVYSTYTLLKHLLDITIENKDELLLRRQMIKDSVRNQEYFTITWELDTARVDTIGFLGYESGYKKSEITQMDRLYYDRTRPKNMNIPFYHHYKEGIRIKRPGAYLLPQSYDKVVELLRLNQVEMTELSQDTVIKAEMYYITSYETSPKPYEGHYIHRDVKLKPVIVEKTFYKGDLLIPMNQSVNRYIIEMLEPQAHDSFFNWNFFDAILSRKEYFAPYVFEERALELLQEHPEWREELEQEKRRNPVLATNAWEQLDWIYRKSPYYEDTHLLYPVARIMD